MVLEDGVFKGDSTNTLGVNITAFSGAPDTKIYIGKSLIDSLRVFTKSVLTPGNAIDGKISNYNEEITDYKDELLKLEDRDGNNQGQIHRTIRSNGVSCVIFQENRRVPRQLHGVLESRDWE